MFQHYPLLIFVATRQSSSKFDFALAAPKIQSSILNLQSSILNQL